MYCKLLLVRKHLLNKFKQQKGADVQWCTVVCVCVFPHPSFNQTQQMFYNKAWIPTLLAHCWLYVLFRLVFPGLFLTTTGPGTVASLARAWVSPMGISCMSSMPQMMSGGRHGWLHPMGRVSKLGSYQARKGIVLPTSPDRITAFPL